MKEKKVLIRGGGEFATGIAHKLTKSGYPVLMLECEYPSAIRRTVSFSDAALEGITAVEGVVCRKINQAASSEVVWSMGEVPLLVDAEASVIAEFQPDVVVDAVLENKSTRTTIDMAPVTIGLGSGFEAGRDVDYVIETMQGHHLGRIIPVGCATPDNGGPRLIAGYGRERIIHAPVQGRLETLAQIGDVVEKHQLIAIIGEEPIHATLTGVLRGMLPNGCQVEQGMRIAEIDPRIEQRQNYNTISDRARCVAGAVLELVVMHDEKDNQ